MFFYCSVHINSLSEQGLVLSEPFGSKRLLLGGAHCWGLIDGVVCRQKPVAHLCQVLLRRRGELEVSVPSSYMV